MKYFFFLLFTLLTLTLTAQEKSDLIGRWDLTIDHEGKKLPSWLEVSKSGISTLVGRFVYAEGSARPVAEIKFEDGQFRFTIPPQWESGSMDVTFIGHLTDSGIAGTMIYTDGKAYSWRGVAAPDLEFNDNPQWGEAISMIGNDLSGWHATGENQWIVEDGILKSPKSGSNLISDQQFKDFKLHVEFKYPEHSNSGIFLRGRYEVQIIDCYGEKPSDILFGGIYGFLTPNQMAAKKAGEWQTYDITLIGRRVTIVANGIPIIQDQIIPGITGGALDSHEGEPGPFFIQGDHGPVEIRNMVVTPIVGKD